MTSYTQFDPPITAAPSALTPAKARKFFEWFAAQIPERVAQLEALVSPPGGKLDYSVGTLALVGMWLDQHLETRALTDLELASEQTRAPEWVRPYLPTTVLTERSLSLCVDVGIYLAEVLRRHHPTLHWTYVQRPKSCFDYHHPVLAGFRYGLYCNPIALLKVAALKAIDGDAAAAELPRLYRAWSSDVDDQQ